MRAASAQTGRASSAAAVVPIAAIATVSAARRSSTGSSSMAGGHALRPQEAILGRPVMSFAGLTWASCQLVA